MDKFPKVTIITPAYNCSKFLGETINSVLRQDYPNIEYIVINDASTDLTGLVMSKYKNRLNYIENDINIGEQATVNRGLTMVTGKYFMIVNADDPLLTGSVINLVDVMESHPDVLCAYPDWRSINEDGSTRLNIKVKDYDFKFMVNHHTCLPSVGSMFRSSIIQSVGLRDCSYRWLGDFDYWYRVGLAGPMIHVPLTLACWRNRAGQASKDKSDLRAKEHIRLASQFKENHQAIAWSLLIAAYVTDSRLNALDYIDHAVFEYPQLLVNFRLYEILWQRAKYILRR